MNLMKNGLIHEIMFLIYGSMTILNTMRFCKFNSILLLLFLACALPAPAQIPLVNETELVPADKHIRATGLITHIIEKYHYKSKELDDALSSAVLERYLDTLDPSKSYFMAEDISRFRKMYGTRLDDALHDEQLDPAFEIFKIFRKRVDERTAYAVKLLDRNFDFNKDEEYVFDRTKLPWPTTESAMDELWRQRLENDVLNLRLAGKEDGNYKDTLRKRYERIRTSTYQLDANDVFQIFINAYTTTIEPHTAYFSPRTSENFDISMRLSLEGIGAVLSSDLDYTVIQHIIPGGPADLSRQLHDEDRIVGVGQGNDGEIIDVIGWRLDDVVDLIRGPKDTVVRLEILPKDSGPEGPNKIMALTRDKIKLEEQAAKSSVIELPEGKQRIGIITLPTFYIDFAAQASGDKNYRSTTRDIKNLITELQKQNIEGLVIDLRGNGGGSLSEALELTGLFIKEGPVVQTKDASGKVEISNDPDPSITYNGPLAVLVDRNSASASEIFAGAIQDYQRGIIIGEPTFGKGTVQNVVDLNRFLRDSSEDLGKLKTTIAQFFRITGSSNQFKGVTPDIVFPTARDGEKYGERSLDNALPWTQVDAAKYTKAGIPINNYLASVKDKYEQRIKSEKAFNLLMQELDLVEKTVNRKSISLQESKRKSELDQLTQTKRALENEIRVTQGLPPLAADAKLEDVEKDAKDEKAPDILLKESALILHDLVVSEQKLPAGLQAVQQNRSEQVNAPVEPN